MNQNSEESKTMDNQNDGEYKECANCGVTDTPLWRKYNDHDLCNACGIYYRVNGFHRPFLPNMRKLLSSARKMGLTCVNCGTKTTSMWRRTNEGDSICNACGLYFRLNGVKRPVSMRKDWIRKRQRKSHQISGIMRLANQNCISNNSSNYLNESNANNVNNTTYDNFSTQNESPLASFHTIQQKSWSYQHYYSGNGIEEAAVHDHQSRLEFNPNNQMSNNFNPESIPFNDIKIDSFTCSNVHNSL